MAGQVTVDERWRRLAGEAAGCRACDLWAHATRTVFGAGAVRAPVMSVGEQPGDQEDRACRPWLERELELVRPAVPVALGATAAQSLLGSSFRLTRQQGVDLTGTGLAPHVIATTHPSLVLRAPDPDVREQTRRRMVLDLAVAAELAGVRP